MPSRSRADTPVESGSRSPEIDRYTQDAVNHAINSFVEGGGFANFRRRRALLKAA
jgi:hypothetical protein